MLVTLALILVCVVIGYKAGTDDGIESCEPEETIQKHGDVLPDPEVIMNREEFIADVFDPPHQKPEEYDDPYQSEEYQKLVESLIPECRCSHDKPCDGLLAGGLCDNLQWENDDSWRYNDDE